ncbi:MAG: lipase family protein, partial [Myxococcota bacterium]
DTLKLRHGPDVKMTPDVILEEAPELPPLTGPTVPTTLNGALAQVVRQQLEANTKELESLELKSNPDAYDRVHPQNTVFANEIACVAAYVPDLTEVTKHLRERGFKELQVFDVGNTEAVAMVTPDERTIAIAFRGTMSVGDVATDLDANFTKHDFQGSSHRGFERYVSAVEAPLNKYVAAVLKKYPDAKLLLTGHSLGAAAAVNYAGRVMADGVAGPQNFGRVITSGAPRVLDAEGIRALEARLPNRMERQVNGRDLVTMVPDPVVISSLANATGTARAFAQAISGAQASLDELIADNTGRYTHDRNVLWYDQQGSVPLPQNPPLRRPSFRDHDRQDYLNRSREWLRTSQERGTA